MAPEAETCMLPVTVFAFLSFTTTFSFSFPPFLFQRAVIFFCEDCYPWRAFRELCCAASDNPVANHWPPPKTRRAGQSLNLPDGIQDSLSALDQREGGFFARHPTSSPIPTLSSRVVSCSDSIPT
ncbi:UNVERIFIED_CONTAM: hypothetical protein K2H54_007271 [Gekko kuhli]